VTPPPDRAPVEGSSWLLLGRRYLAPLLVRQFPPEVPFGFLGRVLPTHAEVDLTLEAHRLPADRALAIAHGAKTVAEAELASGGGGRSAAELELERAAAETLGREVARRSQELWRVGLRCVATGPSRARAEAERLRLSERLAEYGFRTRIPRYEARAALGPTGLTGSEPRPAGYWQTLPTDGVAALFPFADETVLEPTGILVGLSLANASPVFLDRWAHASHSWAIFGATGAGKTFAAALALLRSRWLRPETELILLDPLGEYADFARSLGGTVIRPAAGGADRMNPLDPGTVGDDPGEKGARVGAMLRAVFPSLRDEEAAALDTAIGRLYARGGGAPTFDDLIGEIDRAGTSAGRLPTLLGTFRTGPLAKVNGPTRVATDARTVAVDLAGIPDDQLPFHLAYVLDWVYGRLRARPGPKLVLVDEAHLLVRHEATADFLDRLVRHVRHYDAGLLLVTQNPDDFLARPSGRSLLRNLDATAFLRLPEVSAAAREFFALSPAEAEWLPKARLPRDAGYSEALWRVGGWHLPLAIVASTPEFEFLSATVGRGGSRPP